MVKKHTYEYIKNVVKNHGGTLLSKKYINNANRLKILCSKSHIFYKTFAGITQGSWCPYCVRISLRERFALDISTVKNRIESLGGTLLSNKYVNSHTKLNIKCCNNHIFSMNFNNISNGKWCKECKISGPQNHILLALRKIMPRQKIKINCKDFWWLIGDNGRKLEIDIFAPSLKLAIEYDGGQHFIPIPLWGGKEALSLTKRRDKIKNKLIKQHSEDIKYFIRFNYKEKLTKEYITEKLKKYGVPI